LSVTGTYFYKVSAYNDSGEGSQSSPNTTAYRTAPSTPTWQSQAATAKSATSIELKWNQVTPNSVTGYYIYRSAPNNNASFPTTPTLTIASSSTTTKEDTDLSPNTTYYYKISAYSTTYGESSLSTSTIYATTKPTTPTWASTPTTVLLDTITVNWVSVLNASSYNVYMYNNSGTYVEKYSTSYTTYQCGSLSYGTTYHFKVAAYNSSTGEESLLSADFVSATTVPETPLNQNASAQSSSSIRIRWQQVSGVVTGYRIYRLDSSTSKYELITPAPQIYTDTNSSYRYCTDNSLQPNTTYSYKVVAYNDFGESPMPNTPASAKTN
jgi:hypothetical protein